MPPASRHSPSVLFLVLVVFLAAVLCIPAGAVLTAEDAPRFISKGYDLYDQGRYNESREAFDQAIALDAYSETSWYGRGIASFAAKDYETALQSFEHAISLSPKSERAWMKKGDVFVAMGRNDLALEAYRRAALLNPNNQEAKNKIQALIGASATVTPTSTAATSLTLKPTATVPQTAVAQQQAGGSQVTVPADLIVSIVVIIIIVGILAALWLWRDKVRSLLSSVGQAREQGKREDKENETVPAPPEKTPPGRKPPMNMILIAIVIVAIIAIAVMAVVMYSPAATGTGSQAVTSVQGQKLREYRDNTNYFTLSIPETWNVAVTDSILASDTADRGRTNVRIQPVHLSGSYRSMTAAEIANYIVGQDRQGVSQFSVNTVRASADGKVLEIGTSFVQDGVSMQRMYMIFVNTPYALVSSYETEKALFPAKEELLRTILASYSQSGPPAPAYQGTTGSSLGSLHESNLAEGVRMLLPEGWTATVLPSCSGLVAADQARGVPGVVFVNAIHQSIEPLPPGVTPEDYITTYMPQDFSRMGTTVSDVRILSYEPGDLSALGGNGGNVRAMRVSFLLNGVPCTGSFTVGTYQTGISTAVAYFWGVYSTTGMFDADAAELVQVFNSIDYSSSTVSACRNALNAAWAGARQVGDTVSRNDEQMREENLALYEDRQARNDEFLEKFSDSILDRDRVYNPATDEVYEVDPNFYTYYDTHREEYNYQDMRTLETGEWLRYTPLDGTLHIQ